MRGSEVRFGPFRLDLERHKLSRDEAAIRLGGRALDILCELVAAQGRLVTKDELMARVWAGAIVEENAIQVHISALRKVLDEGNDGPSLVATVSGRGHRFTGATEKAPPPLAEREAEPA